MEYLYAVAALIIITLFLFYKKSHYTPSPLAVPSTPQGTINENFTNQYQQVLSDIKKVIIDARAARKTKDETKTLLEPYYDKIKVVFSTFVDSYIENSV